MFCLYWRNTRIETNIEVAHRNAASASWDIKIWGRDHLWEEESAYATIVRLKLPCLWEKLQKRVFFDVSEDVVMSFCLAGFHLGTPCHSFTRARDMPPGPPPLRSDAQLLGLLDLRAGGQVNVLDRNLFMRFSAFILKIGLCYRIPGTMEKPQRSRIWLCPPLDALIRHKESFWQITHYCAWRMSFKKPTAFLSVLVQLTRVDAHRCQSSKRGICQYTQCPRQQLVGMNSQSQWRSRLAQPYPHSLCDSLAKDFRDFEVSRIGQQFEKYIGRWPA